MAEDALMAITLRNNFYRDGQRQMILILLVSLLANFVLGSMLVYIIMNPPAPKYFPTSINGRITPLIPLDQPNQADSLVLQWANTAATAAYSYSFVNYRTELSAASGFFTPDGWRQYQTALKLSNNLDAVTAKKLIVSAVATSAPVILNSGPLNGVYAWNIRIPIVVTFQNSTEFTQQNNVVTMTIVRVNSLNSSYGIGISQIIVAPAATTGVSG